MCAGSLAIQMHGLHRIQTSLSIHPLEERPRKCFPHPLQDLRDVHGLQASLLRPSVHGPGQTPLHDMRGSVQPQGMWDMPPNVGETKISCVTMELGIMDKGLAKLVFAVHRLPHLHELQGHQAVEAVRASLLLLHTVWRQERMRSLRPTTATNCVPRIAMATCRECITKLESALPRLPLLRSVPRRERSTSLRSQCKRVHRMPAPLGHIQLRRLQQRTAARHVRHECAEARAMGQA